MSTSLSKPFLALDISCESDSRGRKRTTLIGSGSNISIPLQLHCGAFVFHKEGLSSDAVLELVFTPEFVRKHRTVIERKLADGEYFKTQTMHSLWSGESVHTYSRYHISTRVENPYNIPVGTSSQRLTVLRVVCTSHEYISYLSSQIRKHQLGFVLIYPYISSDESLMFSSGLRFPQLLMHKSLGIQPEQSPQQWFSQVDPTAIKLSPRFGEMLCCFPQLIPFFDQSESSVCLCGVSLWFFTLPVEGIVSKPHKISSTRRLLISALATYSPEEMKTLCSGYDQVCCTVWQSIPYMPCPVGEDVVETMEDERSLLGMVLGILSHLNPDCFVGYEILDKTFEFLFTRALQLGFTCDSADLSRLQESQSARDVRELLKRVESGRVIVDLKLCLENSFRSLSHAERNPCLFLCDANARKPVNFSPACISNDPRCDLWASVETNYRYLASRKQYAVLRNLIKTHFKSSMALLKQSQYISLRLNLGRKQRCRVKAAMSHKTLEMNTRWVAFLLYSQGEVLIPPRAHAGKDCPLVHSSENRSECTCSEFRPQHTSYEGGYRYLKPGCEGFHVKRLLSIDAGSMYPTSLILGNHDIPQTSQVLVPVMRKLISKRKECLAKSKFPGDKYAIAALCKKLLANTVYGAFGSQHFRFYLPRIASGICSTAREFIKQCCVRVPQLYPGLVVIYVNTDGILLEAPWDFSESELSQLMESLVEGSPGMRFNVEGRYDGAIIRNKGHMMFKLSDRPWKNTESCYHIKNMYNNRSVCAAVRVSMERVISFLSERLFAEGKRSFPDKWGPILEGLFEEFVAIRSVFYSYPPEYFCSWQNETLQSDTGESMLLGKRDRDSLYEKPTKSLVGRVLCLGGVHRCLDEIKQYPANCKIDLDYYWREAFKNQLLSTFCGNMSHLAEWVKNCTVFSEYDGNQTPLQK